MTTFAFVLLAASAVFSWSVDLDVDNVATNVPLGAGRFSLLEIPKSEFAHPHGVKTATLLFDGTWWHLECEGHIDEDSVCAPIDHPAAPFPTGTWHFEKNELGDLQGWRPAGHNATLGDVAGIWYKGRLHVFYLADRRHHGSKAGAGGHFFAHVSTADLKTWKEHAPAVPLTEWWQTVGTGTPFVLKDGRLALAYGFHTERMDKELAKGKPVGATYAISDDDGETFEPTGRFFHSTRNPTVFNRPDGRYGMVTGYHNEGGVYVSDDLENWTLVDDTTGKGGDCPCLFEWNGHHYLIQGYIGDERFLHSTSGNPGSWEDWSKDIPDLYAGLAVPMVVEIPCNRRLLMGWRPDRGPKGLLWGGAMEIRELKQAPDGRLRSVMFKRGLTADAVADVRLGCARDPKGYHYHDGPHKLRADDLWAGRPSHVAVVNPVGRGEDPNVLSLRGDWEFATGPHAMQARDLFCQRGVNFHGRDTWKDATTVKVPGCWEASGVGEPGFGSGHHGDSKRYALRNRHWGNGWYRKRITIPAAWAGKRIWFKEGGVRVWGWFWIDGRPVGRVTDNHGSRKWDVTDLVTPGREVEVVAQVDNTYPSRNNQALSVHHWGGLVRDVEFEATPATFIDDCWVKGDFDARKARIEVEVEGGGEQWWKNLVLQATVEGETVECPLSTSTSSLHLEVPLRHFRPWSPEHPNLYWATVELVKDGVVTMTRRERFGVRKFEVRGKEFYLNGKPFFFRGFGDDSTYPLTGFSPASREEHLAHLLKARKAGFNYVRTHTHYELPEYFEAADEAGIIVQGELSYACDEASEETFVHDPLGDAEAVVRTYRRYPSWGVFSGGNEGTHGPALGKTLYDYVKAQDLGLLVIEQDGGTYLRNHEGGASDYASGPMTMWERGSFNPRAFICHEYMNLAIKVDYRAAPKYTGVFKPRTTRASRHPMLEAAGLTEEWGERLQDAQNAVQAYWQKCGIESARKDPFCDGYVFWTILDFGHPSEATGMPVAQGYLDPFWDVKRCGNSLETFATFNSPSCILIDTEDRMRVYREATDKKYCCTFSPVLRTEETNRVYEAGSEIPVEFILAHYGEEDLSKARLAWSFADADGRVLLAGTSATVGRSGPDRRTLATHQPVHTLAKERIRVPAVAKPTKVTMTVRLGSLVNSWPFWFLPQTTIRSSTSTSNFDFPSVVIAPLDSPEAEAARKAGKNLLVYSKLDSAPNIMPNWWDLNWGKFDFVGAAAVPHAVWGDFPYEPHLSPLLMRIFHRGEPMPVPGYRAEDAVVVTEGMKACFLNFAAKTRPDGSREVLVSGIDIFADLPEARLLKKNILGWLEEGVESKSGVQVEERTGSKIRVACIGDSITWGTAMTNRVVECYPAQLQRMLGDGYDVRNFGDPGAGVYSDPKRLPDGWRAHPWRTGRNGLAAYAFAPDIVVCNLGINDNGTFIYEYTYDEKGVPKTEPGLFRREYVDLLRAFGRNGKMPRIILWTRLGPIGKIHRSKGRPNPFLMEPTLRAVAAEVGAETLDMYTPLLPFAETEHFAADGIHPEGGAQRVIAEITARQIQNLKTSNPQPDLKWMYPQMDMELYRVHAMRDDVRRMGLYASHPGELPPLRNVAEFRRRCAADDPLPEVWGRVDETHYDVTSGVRYVSVTAGFCNGGAIRSAEPGWEGRTFDGTWHPVAEYPDAPVPPHRERLPEDRAFAGLVATNGWYDVGEERLAYVECAADRAPCLFVGESVPEMLCEDKTDMEYDPTMICVADGRWRTERPLAFRYFRFQEPVRDVKVVPVGRRRPVVGSVRTGDARRERMFEVGVRTLALCSDDFLIDGVKRDRLPWGGDLTVSLLADAYVYGDAEIARRSLSVLDAYEGDVNKIVNYSMWTIISHDLYQLYFGDRKFLEDRWWRIKGRVEQLVSRTDERGFVLRGLDWVFVDWAKPRSVTALHVIWYGALQAAARLADRVGDTRSAFYRELAEKVRTNVDRLAWDETRGIYRADPDDAPVFGRQANVFAVVLGLADAAKAARIGDALAGDGLPPVGTPYVYGWELVALARTGHHQAFFDGIEKVFGAMLDAGATTFWEGYDASEKGDARYGFYGRPWGKSLCHVWSAWPAFVFVSEAMGVKPTSDGWQTWQRKPIAGAERFRAVVPTPKGSLYIGESTH